MKVLTRVINAESGLGCLAWFLMVPLPALILYRATGDLDIATVVFFVMLAAYWLLAWASLSSLTKAKLHIGGILFGAAMAIYFWHALFSDQLAERSWEVITVGIAGHALLVWLVWAQWKWYAAKRNSRAVDEST